MITIIELCQLFQTLLIRNTKSFTHSFNIRFHLRGKLSLADTADGRVLVEQTDVVEVVEFAEDAELRELGNTRDEGELQVWIKHLQRTVEVLHDKT